MENLKVELVEKPNDGAKESASAAPTPAAEKEVANLQSKTSASSTAEHDLDVFLLGDLGSSGDEGPGMCFILNSMCTTVTWGACRAEVSLAEVLFLIEWRDSSVWYRIFWHLSTPFFISDDGEDGFDDDFDKIEGNSVSMLYLLTFFNSVLVLKASQILMYQYPLSISNIDTFQIINKLLKIIPVLFINVSC